MADPYNLKVDHFQGNWCLPIVGIFKQHVVVPVISVQDAGQWNAALHRINLDNFR
jgi:hypothetical protein